MRAAVVPRASTVPDASSSTHSRRGFTAASLVGVVLGVAPRKRVRAEIVDVFADAPPSPESGACADCVGEYNGYLNTCDRARTSCVSSQNDDAAHFAAPWAYEGARVDAMKRLVGVASGDVAARGRAGDDIMRSRGRGARAEGGRDVSRKVLSFVSRVEAFDEELGYVRLALAPRDGSSGDETLAEDDDRFGGVFDAEFLFMDNDEVVNVRVAQRGENERRRGKLKLSYTDFVAFDDNLARSRAEELRIAIGWELIPVIAAFDPKWSDKETLWFERLFNAASGRPSPEYDLDDMRDTMSYD